MSGLRAEVEEIEERLSFLMRRVELLELLIDPNRNRWAYLQLEDSMSRADAHCIMELLESCHVQIESGTRITQWGFESGLLQAFPRLRNPSCSVYDFAKRLLMTIGTTGQFPAVFDHFQKAFNVMDRERLQEN